MNQYITQNDLDRMKAWNEAQSAYEWALYANDDDFLFNRITHEQHEAKRKDLETHHALSIRLIVERYGKSQP